MKKKLLGYVYAKSHYIMKILKNHLNIYIFGNNHMQPALFFIPQLSIDLNF